MVVFAVKVMINSLKLKFSRNSFSYVLLKFNRSSFVEIFVRVLYKEKFIVITPFKTGTYLFVALHFFLELINARLCIKPEIQKRGTECEERGEWAECGNVISRECLQTFWGMSPNIPRQTFRVMSSNIPWNIPKYFRECCQTFRRMSPNIPGNVARHIQECT